MTFHYIFGKVKKKKWNSKENKDIFLEIYLSLSEKGCNFAE
jgi:hypothetical protein